jgi:L-fuconolactonase
MEAAVYDQEPMIVDAHAHVWKADPKWPDPAATLMSPASDIPLSLFRRYLDEHGVARAVLVQPMYPGEDNSLVTEAVRTDPARYAAVAVVDPRKPGAADLLETWVGRGCRGLRLRPSFPGELEGFSSEPVWDRARSLNITVSVLARQEHLPLIAAQAARYPEVPVVVDHLAHPDPASFGAILELANLPNVHVKPTGFYYYSKQPYPYEDCKALVRAVLDRFGPDRLVWGSDFPHVLLRSGYGPMLKLLERWLPESARAKVLGGNAERLYWKGGPP